MQVSPEARGNSEGTGLGLTICKQFVDIMGGHMTMTSEVRTAITASNGRKPAKRADEERSRSG